MNIRVKFNKHGIVRYIGHLDVMRYFQKALRRAEIDVAYTAGFSPHQIMTFASPLGVGLESNGEYMDIKVNSMISCEDLMQKINQASVPGIQAVKVTLLPDDAPNAMASVAAAEYYVSFKENKIPVSLQKSKKESSKEESKEESNILDSEKLQKMIEEYLNQDTIPFIKETKKGTREIDLKTGIYDFSWDEEEQAMHMLLNASSGDNIKPVQVLDVMLAKYQDQLAEHALLITREDIYMNIGSEEAPKLIPLSEFGQN